jgi:glutathione S-transferase
MSSRTVTKSSDITLYTDQTPNGVKIPIALELLGLSYKVVHIDISTNKQKEPWFLEINPNGRIPAMTDSFYGGGTICLFESGSILQYIVDEYDKGHKISFVHGTKEYYETNNWLFFQNAGLGPMQGQANHFVRYAPEKIEYGMKRYVNETRRLYSVLEEHFKKSKSQYLVNNRITIADITHIGWVLWAGWAGVDIEEYPLLKAWRDRMMENPAVRKGNDVPEPSKILELLKDPEKVEDYAKHLRGWIMKANEKDVEK